MKGSYVFDRAEHFIHCTETDNIVYGMYCNKTCKTNMILLYMHFLKFKDQKKYTQKVTKTDSASAMMNNKETIMRACMSSYITGMYKCAYMCVCVCVCVHVCTYVAYV